MRRQRGITAVEFAVVLLLLSVLLAVSALLQWLAAVTFVTLAWPRVKDRYRGE